MGKQKIDQLLAQLKENHQQDIQNAAGIFAVAQAAVNELAQEHTEPTLALKPAKHPAPSQLTQGDLMARYGSYNNCRKAAKQAGITFSRPPRWAQLIAAFNYLPVCQSYIKQCLQQQPNPNLQGVKITFDLEALQQ